MLLNEEDSKRKSGQSNYYTQDPEPYDFESRQSKTKKPKFAAESQSLVQSCIRECQQPLEELRQARIQLLVQTATNGNDIATFLYSFVSEQNDRLQTFLKSVQKTASAYPIVSPPKAKSQLESFLETLYLTILEQRTDWLAIEAITLANDHGIQIPDLAKLACKIRTVFRSETEALSNQAVQNDGLTMGEISDSVRRFYLALPPTMFLTNTEQQPQVRMKSQKPRANKNVSQSPSPVKIEKQTAKTKVQTVLENYTVKKVAVKTTAPKKPAPKKRSAKSVASHRDQSVESAQDILDQEPMSSKFTDFDIGMLKRFKH